MLKATGAYYTIVREDTGEEIKFMAKQWQDMMRNDESLREYCYNKICEIFVMKYKDKNTLDPEEITLDDNDDLSDI